MTEIELVSVFTHLGRGGNPCPIVVDASNLPSAGMQSVARHFGHESGFVLPAPGLDSDYTFRFWVPRHEMEMCGHATIGALWALAIKGRLPGEQVRIQTLSGPVTGYVDRGSSGEPSVEISQPVGKVVDLTRAEEDEVLSALKISRGDLLDLPVQNAVTSRVKTLVPIKGGRELNELVPDPAQIEACCGRIGSTGLYPYAIEHQGERRFEARQFPKSSGYPEDAATGIAAAALAFGLLRNGLVERNSERITVMQGRAMDALSEIHVRLGFAGSRPVGCLLGGSVTLVESHILQLEDARPTADS
ncbi:phenazine biosynthesis protein PhzF [Bradyrhizobium sp. LTSP849]|uniref:PhzF family phenazine biosynthesis protein n=1 Tax=Bradyrhizobium sp. LTSP849 TaxID=1615890 RepID=UPI0005D26F60|nr:PhzF family phenazine biosynthesis isomerase [Bradyrhizobium sp. LTSP849]KJC50052.1 phenazine biosynthesis protein PhzF [Bradyrhizobium sp. LTSP849]